MPLAGELLLQPAGCWHVLRCRMATASGMPAVLPVNGLSRCRGWGIVAAPCRSHKVGCMPGERCGDGWGDTAAPAVRRRLQDGALFDYPGQYNEFAS